MPEGYLSPAEIVASLMKALLADRGKLAKYEAELPNIRKAIKKGERFIRGACDVWSIPVPIELTHPDLERVPVPTHPKPGGIAVIKGFPCPECDTVFSNPQGRGIHVKWKHRER